MFVILGRITGIETIAVGWRIRELPRLVRLYGFGRWRKRKGIARILLKPGETFSAEIHWFEATGRGRHEMKIKRILND